MSARRFLLDQMLDTAVAREIARRGHDVVRLAEVGMSRADDERVLERAIKEDRTLITLDRHFGDWAVLPLAEHPGVIRLEADPATSDNVLGVLIPFLENHPERSFRNTLAIAGRKGVRLIKTA